MMASIQLSSLEPEIPADLWNMSWTLETSIEIFCIQYLHHLVLIAILWGLYYTNHSTNQNICYVDIAWCHVVSLDFNSFFIWIFYYHHRLLVHDFVMKLLLCNSQANVTFPSYFMTSIRAISKHLFDMPIITMSQITTSSFHSLRL